MLAKPVHDRHKVRRVSSEYMLYQQPVQWFSESLHITPSPKELRSRRYETQIPEQVIDVVSFNSFVQCHRYLKQHALMLVRWYYYTLFIFVPLDSIIGLYLGYSPSGCYPSCESNFIEVHGFPPV